MAKKRLTAKPRQSVRGVAAESEPKTTRPESPSRREEPAQRTVEQKIGRTLDAFPDKIDLRDWAYHPTLEALPDEIVNCALLLGMQKFLERDQKVLDLLASEVDGLPGIVVSGEGDTPGAMAKSDTYGGFDNDPNTMNSVLVRILGGLPKRAFTERDLQF